MSVNKAILVGRLGKDPELKYTQSGKAVTTFSIATDQKWTGQDGQKNEETTWHNIVVWGRMAETCKEYLHKGSQVYVEGRIVNRSYENKEGQKKYISEVVAHQVQFLGGKNDSGGQGASQGGKGQGMKGECPSNCDLGSGGDDDLPF